MNAALRILLATVIIHGLTAHAEEGMTAKDIAARLSANITDGSSLIRLRMVVNGSTLQLQLKERRTKSGTDILYQVLFPKARKGEAVLLQKKGGRATGKVFTPGGGVQNIGSMKDPMFGGDLSYEDVVENFFNWDQQSLAGAEEVDHKQCQILESKPDGGSSYSRVRTWVDLRKMVPLRVEKYSGSTLVRRIDTDRVAEDDLNRAVVASLTVKRPAQGTSTEIEGSDIRHDVTYTDKDFSEEGMQVLGPPPKSK
jgi:hypothetical protein